jgi:hypothetical protein
LCTENVHFSMVFIKKEEEEKEKEKENMWELALS